MALTHWQVSCWLNRLLCGRRGMPLCARIYARPPSLWRTAFLRLMGLAFRDPGHCESVWRRWRAMQVYPPITGRRHPDPGY